MDTQLIIYLELGAIGILLAAVGVLFKKIKELQRQLAEEKQKRTYPLLILEIDKENLKAYLKNESYCYAKDVQVEDCTVTVDYGFKKQLVLKFEPIVLLKPAGRMELEYKVFDNNFDVTSQSPDSLVLQFHDTPSFMMHLRYKNLEEDAFKSTIAWEGDQYVVKEVVPIEKNITPVK